MRNRSKIKEMIEILSSLLFTINSIKEIAVSLLDKKLNRDCIIIIGENHLSELDGKLQGWIIEKIEPNEVLLEYELRIKNEDIKDYPQNPKILKNIIREDFINTVNLKNYLKKFGEECSLQEEDIQKLERILLEHLQKHSSKRKKISLNTNLINIDSKTFYDVCNFIKECIISLSKSEKTDDNTKKYLSCLQKLYEFLLKFGEIERVMYRFLIKEIYVKIAMNKIGIEPKCIENEILASEFMECVENLNKYNKYEKERIQQILNLKDKHMANEIIKVIDKYKKKNQKYRIVVIVGDGHVEGIERYLKEKEIKNVRVIRSFSKFDLKAHQIEGEEYVNFLLKFSSLFHF